MGKIIDADDAIKAIKAIPRLILDPKGEFQPVEPTTKAMIDPDDAVAAIENLPLAKPGFDSVVKLDKAFDDGYKQGYLQAESDLSISQPHENDRLNNQVHLCNSCKYDFPDCPSKNDDIVFGNGVGDDNICACSKYVPSVQSGREVSKWIKIMQVTETKGYVSYKPKWYCARCMTKYSAHTAKFINFCYKCGAYMRQREK